MSFPSLKRLIFLGTIVIIVLACGWVSFSLYLFWNCRPCTNQCWLQEKEIPFPCGWQVRKTSTLAKDFKIVLREGRKGLRKTFFIFEKHGNCPLQVRILRERIIKKSLKGDMLVGRSRYPNPIEVPRETRILKVFKLNATAYSPGAEDNSGAFSGVTALGWPTGYGIVAVDPKVIPLRSLLYIEGYGFAWAGDTGGAIKGNRIDLCFSSKTKVDEYGHRTARVYLVAAKNRKVPIMASTHLFPRYDKSPYTVGLKNKKKNHAARGIKLKEKDKGSLASRKGVSSAD